MSTEFLRGLESTFAWMLEASWQASLLAALVLLLQWALRGRLNPRWHHALWLLVIARLILPVLPESALSLFQFTPPPPPLVEQTITEPIFSSAPLTPEAPVVTKGAPMLPSYPFSAFTVLALLWLVGALGLLLLTWCVNRRYARHVLIAPAVTDPRLLQLADAAKQEIGIRHRLRMIESARVQSPAIMGLFRPTLILPKDVCTRFDNDELHFIFLHEFAHLKRGDLFLQWLVALLQILHWFNPVLWHAFRRMRIDREPATDALVLSCTGEAYKEPYGQVLVKLLEHYHQRHSLPTLVGILEDKDQFKRRFSLIGRFTRGAYGWSLLGVLLIAILAVACLTRSEPTAHDVAEIDHAAWSGDLKKVEALLKKNPDLAFSQGENNETLLHWAAGSTSKDAPKVVALLLADGAKVNARANGGGTPLHNAAFGYGSQMEIARLLLSHGAEVNAKADNGATPLLEAAANNPSTEMPELLLEHGAEINVKDNTGATPMHAAASISSRNVAEWLLAHGAEVNGKLKDGRTPLHLAVDVCGSDFVEMLLTHGAEVNAKDNNGQTPLHYLALYIDKKDVAELLRAHGADVNAKDNQGFTPLHYAVVKGNKDVAELLRGGQGLGETLAFSDEIHDAAKKGDLEKIKALLKDHPELIFSKDDGGRTPLFWAIAWEKYDVAEFLLSHGADYNIFSLAAVGDLEKAKTMLKDHSDLVFSKDEDGQTPLHKAANKAMAELLLAHGADINARDNHGNTPLFSATLWGRHMDVAEVLVANKADVNAKGDGGLTPLHLAACNSSKNGMELMESLLAHGADINIKDNNGMTPVFGVAVSGKKVAELLLAHGADVNARSNDGWTPLIWAAASDNGPNENAAEVLVAHGADVNATNNKGFTPLYYAIRNAPLYYAVWNGNEDVVQLLRQHGGQEYAQTISDQSKSSEHQSAFQLVLEFKNSKVSWEQFEIAEKIVTLHDPGVLPELASLLTDQNRHQRGNAAFIFARLGDDRGFEVIKAMITDRSDRPDVEGMGRRDDGRYDVTLQIQQDRYYASWLLGDLKDPRAVPVLVPLLHDENINYRVATSLGEIGDQRAVAPLIEALSEKDPSVRVCVIYALQQLKAKEALPRLRGLLNDREKCNFDKMVSVGEAAKAAITDIETKP